jgi:broad specificity phosphatase PhoE
MNQQVSSAPRFGLLRHGQTVWNLQKRIQGRADSELTEEGLRYCRDWGMHLAGGAAFGSWERIVCSPAPRARRSAQIINEYLHLPLEEDYELREMDWGLWEGLTSIEIEAAFPGALAAQIERGWSFRPPQGESRAEVRKRVLAALHRLTQAYPGTSILLVSHLGVIKALIYHIEARDYLPDEANLIDNNRLHIIVGRDGAFRRGRYNLTPAKYR